MAHYYRTCPYCGSHLDPGEPCDCQDKPARSKWVLTFKELNQLLDQRYLETKCRRKKGA